jgi:hypothetical protein
MTGRKEAGGEERLSFQLYVAWEDEEGTESEGGQEGLERRPPDEAALYRRRAIRLFGLKRACCRCA